MKAEHFKLSTSEVVNIHRVNVKFGLNFSSNPVRSLPDSHRTLNSALMGKKSLLLLGRGGGDWGKNDFKCQILGGLLKRFISSR